MTSLTLLGVGGPPAGAVDVAYAIPLGFPVVQAASDNATNHAGLPIDFRMGVSSTWANGHFEIPVAGTITAISFSWRNTGVLASGESVITSIRFNDTSDLGSTNEARFDVVFETLVVTGLSQAVVAGDKIALKIVNPSYGTNPTGPSVSALVYIS